METDPVVAYLSYACRHTRGVDGLRVHETLKGDAKYTFTAAALRISISFLPRATTGESNGSIRHRPIQLHLVRWTWDQASFYEPTPVDGLIFP